MDGYGEFIKRHRIASGYKSQRRLAEKSGVSPATISRIESEIQKPEVRTLKTLSDYLTTTSYVELMVVCGYWDEDELLEDIKEDGPQEMVKIDFVEEDRNVYGLEKSKSVKNAEEFIQRVDMDVATEELTKLFNLEIDGRVLTESEAKGIIAYVRSLRQIEN